MDVYPKVSVAMATYNGGRYIAEQLQSILKQTRLPDEVIISDDGSQDATLEIAESLLRDSGVHYCILTNRYEQGYPTNFSTALEATTGEYIFLADQDDSWLPEKVAVAVAELDRTGAELLVHDAWVAWGAITNTGRAMSAELERRGMKRQDNYFGCMTIIRRSLADAVLPIDDPHLGHDQLFNIAAKARGTRFYLDRPLMTYRRHDRNVSKNAPVGDFTPPSRARRILAHADYDWLLLKMRTLAALYPRLFPDGPNVEPGGGQADFLREYERTSLRMRLIFSTGFWRALTRYPAYASSGLRFMQWAKDLSANAVYRIGGNMGPPLPQHFRHSTRRSAAAGCDANRAGLDVDDTTTPHSPQP